MGIKKDIDSLETVVDVKKIDGTLYNQFFLNQQQFQIKILTAHAVLASVKLNHRKLSLTPFDPDRKYKHKVKLF